MNLFIELIIILCVLVIINYMFSYFSTQYEHFYEFRIPSSLNRTVLLQLSDKSMNKYYENNHIFTPPYEDVVCK